MYTNVLCISRVESIKQCPEKSDRCILLLIVPMESNGFSGRVVGILAECNEPGASHRCGCS